jgi:putative pyruvate formate lyase activating enzyme
MMSTVATRAQREVRRGRRHLAASRLGLARAALASCELCVQRCAVNRLRGPAGACGAGDAPRAFSAQVEVGDELQVIPAFAIALAGCNIRCAFCITGDESWHASRGTPADAASLAARATQVLGSASAKCILILGGEPTVHLPWLIDFVARLPDDACLVLKTNGLVTAAARDLLDGLFDVWIIDHKFGNDGCAQRLSRTGGYLAAIEETLLWAHSHTDLIVRHLLMPGHAGCCWKPVASWLAAHLPQARVSLRFGYWPAWKARRLSSLDQPVTGAEQADALAVARRFGLRLVP